MPEVLFDIILGVESPTTIAGTHAEIDKKGILTIWDDAKLIAGFVAGVWRMFEQRDCEKLGHGQK